VTAQLQCGRGVGGGLERWRWRWVAAWGHQRCGARSRSVSKESGLVFSLMSAGFVPVDAQAVGVDRQSLSLLEVRTVAMIR